jgi:hypothetical protein
VSGLLPAKAQNEVRDPDDLRPKVEAPHIRVEFHKGDQNFPDATMRFGILLPKLPEPKMPFKVKQLTYDPFGRTSNTCLKIDGKQVLLGQAPGRWMEREGKLPKGRQGLRSVWTYPDQKVNVTQVVEVVKGEQTGNVDTCRVVYTLENKDDQAHSVGLRFLLDTLIGTNDGAPFVVPGEKTVCDSQMDFKTAAKVPAFAQALERLDFKNPGVVAHLKLNMGPGMEGPSRVSLGAWPDPRSKIPGAAGPGTMWEVPVFSMKVNNPPDSAVVIYWGEKKMAASSKRTMGFTFGLGNFSTDKDGKLGLMLAGPFQAGADMTIVAVAKELVDGQTISLKLPEGVELKAGDLEQKVPTGGAAGLGPVTWTVRTPKTGIFALTVATSGGASIRQGVRINPSVGAEKEKGSD